MPAWTEIKEGQCESCHIFIGGKEEPWCELTEYKEHKLCGWCINLWRRRERETGHTISWDEFRKGKIKKAPRNNP